MVIVNFIRDNEVGIFARAKRLAKGKQLPSGGVPSCQTAAAGSEAESDDTDGLDEEYSDKSE